MKAATGQGEINKPLFAAQPGASQACQPEGDPAGPPKGTRPTPAAFLKAEASVPAPRARLPSPAGERRHYSSV